MKIRCIPLAIRLMNLIWTWSWQDFAKIGGTWRKFDPFKIRTKSVQLSTLELSRFEITSKFYIVLRRNPPSFLAELVALGILLILLCQPQK